MPRFTGDASRRHTLRRRTAKPREPINHVHFIVAPLRPTCYLENLRPVGKAEHHCVCRVALRVRLGLATWSPAA